MKQILIIEPKVIIPLGNFATKLVMAGFDVEEMGSVPAITKLHGEEKKVKLQQHEFSVVPMFHPAAALYTGERLKESMLKDFQNLETLLRKDLKS